MERPRMRRPLTSMLSAILFALPSSHAIAQSLKDHLVGTWRLVKWTFDVEGKEKPASFGPDSIGLIIYSADGYMCAALMQPNRPNFASNE
jgi:hypothetical protein